MTGEELYRDWLGDPEGVTDAARYYPMMNPAQKAQWERLAAKVTVYRETLEGVRDGLARRRDVTPSLRKLLATLGRVLSL